MQCKFLAFLLIGLPGSGKSTQGKILDALPGTHYWKAGDVFRAVAAGSEISRVIHARISHGELIPDELAVSLCLDDLRARVMAGEYRPSTDLLVLDGIPRTVRQAELLEEYVAVAQVLYLVCDDVEEVVRRLRRRSAQQGRTDDAEEHIIRRRLMISQRHTARVIEYYPPERLARIDALRPPAEVFDQILHRVIAWLKRRQLGPADEL